MNGERGRREGGKREREKAKKRKGSYETDDEHNRIPYGHFTAQPDESIRREK